MGKKVLIVSTSLRGKSNSETLAHEFERGAKDAGHDVEFLSLKGKKINFCVGCLTCGTRGRCFMDDDAIAIEEKFMAADVVVWATPIYYYAPSGSMKTLIDRLNPLYSKDYRFRDIYVLSTTAENAEPTPARVDRMSPESATQRLPLLRRRQRRRADRREPQVARSV